MTEILFIFSIFFKKTNQDAIFHTFNRKNVNFICLNKELIGFSTTRLVGDWYFYQEIYVCPCMLLCLSVY